MSRWTRPYRDPHLILRHVVAGVVSVVQRVRVVIDTRAGERIRTPIVRAGDRPRAPLGHVTMYLSELEELARTLNAMADSRNGRVPA